MDKYERCLQLLKKWNSDAGATTEELKELRILLSHVSNEVTSTIALRIEEVEAE